MRITDLFARHPGLIKVSLATPAIAPGGPGCTAISIGPVMITLLPKRSAVFPVHSAEVPSPKFFPSRSLQLFLKRWRTIEQYTIETGGKQGEGYLFTERVAA